MALTKLYKVGFLESQPTTLEVEKEKQFQSHCIQLNLYNKVEVRMTLCNGSFFLLSIRIFTFFGLRFLIDSFELLPTICNVSIL